MSNNSLFQKNCEESFEHFCKSQNLKPENLNNQQWYQFIANFSQEVVTHQFPTQAAKEARTVNYLSMEFLIGRLLGNNLMNMGLHDIVDNFVSQYGKKLTDILEEERDPALGNGGLGRLAACYLDSMASLSQPAVGYGLHYQYGLFKQSFGSNGEQLECGDAWKRDFYPQQHHVPSAQKQVHFGGSVQHVSNDQYSWNPALSIYGEAFDLPIVGYNGIQQPLRLWQGYNEEGMNLVDFNDGEYLKAEVNTVAASQLTKVLYPNDNHQQGKELRLMQQYFHCACSITDILDNHIQAGRSLESLSNHEVIQLNDTHPALAIPELLRILIDTHGLDWDSAWEITQKTFAYTNHTLLPEALEQWDKDMVARILPRHMMIIERINNELYLKAKNEFSTEEFPKTWENIAIISPKTVKMANLCVVGSYAVNGVAKIHSQLVMDELFPEYARLFPGRFHNVTNGVTPRRWMRQANPALSDLIDRHVDGDWVTDLSLIKQIEPLAENAEFQQRYDEIKQHNKRELADLIKHEIGLEVNCDAIFDVQIKRFHEYKRQHLNLLNIIALYQELKANPDLDVVPRVFIFSGKAAPGYFMAKQIIQAINGVANVINNDPVAHNKLQVVFLPDYRVSLAEKIIPAADVSEQISLAGKEASGTGNMKLALNGAITIGTLDGANIEIADYAGEDNVVIFGHTVSSVRELRAQGYNSRQYYDSDKRLQKAIDALADGSFSDGDTTVFEALVNDMLNHDYFCVLADFASYYEAQQEIAARYTQKTAWLTSAILNTARLSHFSSDRSIRDYQQHIW